MAPLDTRQYHSFSPSTPGYGKETPGRPVAVHTFIDPTTFIELFAGTVAIFIFSVLFWKLGKFFRSLTRHRVLRDGKLTTSRYARTWYGWVPAEVHERNKAFLRRTFRYIREWLSWESPRTDYQWMWWDPGLEAMEERRAKRKRLKLLPECLKSYEEVTAVRIPFPRSSIECHGALVNSHESETSQPIEFAPEWDRIAEPLPRIDFKEHIYENSMASSISREISTPPSRAHTRSSDDRPEGSLRVNGRMVRQLLTLPTNVQSLPTSTHSRRGPGKWASWAGENTSRVRRHLNLSTVQNSLHATELSSDSGVHRSFQTKPNGPKPVFGGARLASQRYRAWSAQMQAKAMGLVQSQLRDSSGPPGTPLTALLASYVSEQPPFDSFPETSKEAAPVAKQQSSRIHLTPSHGPLHRGRRSKHASSLGMDTTYAKFNTAPARFRPPKRPATLTAHTSNQPWHSWQDADTPHRQKPSIPRTGGQPWRPRARARNRYSTLPNCMDGRVDGAFENDQVSIAKLSDWEVRLIDQLNRKLGWVYNELTPGQKPYHFALLANHWLNRETWLVIDPISRVSLEHRRQWGDPRFGSPNTEYDRIPRLKYPATVRRRAHLPRIDSWRAAVNKQRRVSGNRNAIRTVELYEDSAEEPPDGHIDPACWILPKPPQGFETSTRQKNAWYEGGSGWQEKLEDWQKVRHGYRLHKFVHEGRANRDRVKEAASQVQRGCRIVSLKLLPRETEQPQVAP